MEVVKMIKISKEVNGEMVEFEYDSINHACRENAATSGVSRETGLRYLAKQGFDIDTLVETKSSKAKVTLLDKVAKRASKVDKDKVKEITKKRDHLVNNLTDASDYDKLLKLNEELDKAKNPNVTLQACLDLITQMWNEERGTTEEAETSTAPSTKAPKNKKSSK
jgi:hypothetical protein